MYLYASLVPCFYMQLISQKSWEILDYRVIFLTSNFDLPLIGHHMQLSWIKQWFSTSIVDCPSPSRGLVALACVSSRSN